MALRVLVVDDSPFIRKAIVRALTRTGLELEPVQQAADGREALLELRRRPADLVLLDINMPQMNGIEVLAAMQREPALQAVPVIMITNEGSQSTVMDVAKLGARGFVRKPFIPEQIRQKITECLETARPG